MVSGLYTLRLAPFLICTMLLISAGQVKAADRFADYWTVEEYLEQFPSQQIISRRFIDRVRQEAITDEAIRKPIRIGIIYPGLQVSDYWRRSVTSLEARLQEIAPNYELVSHFTKPDTAISEQAQNLGRFLKQKVDYVVFTLNAARHTELIRKVIGQEGVKLILQNITTPLKTFQDQQPFQYVGFDHVTGTEILAREYIRRTGGEGTYAILYGPRGYVNDMRGGTFLKEMEKHPGMTLKASYYVGFNQQKSYIATKDLLRSQPDLDFIFSSSTDIAFGAIKALKEAGKLGKVMTNGWGGGGSELASIERGELDFTVMRMNDDNGVAMAEAIYLDQIGKSDEVPIVFSGDIRLVDQSMDKAQIGELKNRAFRYSK